MRFQLIDTYGHDLYIYMLRCIVHHIDVKKVKAGQDQSRVELLSEVSSHTKGLIYLPPNPVINHKSCSAPFASMKEPGEGDAVNARPDGCLDWMR